MPELVVRRRGREFNRNRSAYEHTALPTVPRSYLRPPPCLTGLHREWRQRGAQQDTVSDPHDGGGKHQVHEHDKAFEHQDVQQYGLPMLTDDDDLHYGPIDGNEPVNAPGPAESRLSL